jgi:hypothetical protein
MLAFQASGTGSTPVRCIFASQSSDYNRVSALFVLFLNYYLVLRDYFHEKKYSIQLSWFVILQKYFSKVAISSEVLGFANAKPMRILWMPLPGRYKYEREQIFHRRLQRDTS